MRIWVTLCWIATIIASCVAAFDVIQAATSNGISAPQQGALAALAAATCIVPYVFTRAFEGLRRMGREVEQDLKAGSADIPSLHISQKDR